MFNYANLYLQIKMQILAKSKKRNKFEIAPVYKEADWAASVLCR